jgi:hypothetical protein
MTGIDRWVEEKSNDGREFDREMRGSAIAQSLNF